MRPGRNLLDTHSFLALARTASVVSGRRRRSAARALAIAAALTVALTPVANGYVYWAPGIGRANLDGSTVNGGLLLQPFAATVAANDAYVFWGGGGGICEIGRANADGSDPRPTLISGVCGPSQLAVGAQYLYWANGYAHTIGRARLDGTDVQPAFIDLGVGNARGVAVDRDHIFWARENMIGRADLDGTHANPSLISVPGGGGPQQVATDGEYVYWVHPDTTTIGRARIDGTGLDDAFIQQPASGGLAVDAGHIYWGTFAGGSQPTAIGRADRDGTHIDPAFITPPVASYLMGVTSVAVNAPTSYSTATTITPSEAVSVYGDASLTFRADVRSPAGNPAPSGSVQFDVNGDPDGGPVALDVRGRAVYDSSFYLNVGDTVTARYLGDPNHDPSRAEIRPQINPAPTTATLAGSRNPSTAGDDILVTATVSNVSTQITPFGGVIFTVDGEPVTAALPLDEDGQVAIRGGADLPAGVYAIGADYHDDTGYPADFTDSHATLTQHVNPASSPVAAPTPAPATPTPAPATPTPAPAAAQGSTSAAQLSAMTATLVKALRKHGLKALTSARQTLTTGGPGALAQKVYSAASARTSKTTLLASGRRRFQAAGRGTLRLELSSAGLRAIRGARRVKLAIVTRFTPTTGKPIAVTTRITVRVKQKAATSTRSRPPVAKTQWHLVPTPRAQVVPLHARR